MKNRKTAYFPEPPSGQFYPQLLGVKAQGGFYRLQLETFHTCEKPAAQTNHPEHSHDVFHIVFYVQGDNFFKLDGERVESHPGTLALVPPGVPHCFAPLLPEGSGYHEITFSLIAGDKRLKVAFPELLAKYYGAEIKTERMLMRLERPAAVRLDELYFELENVLSEYNSAFPFPVYQKLGEIFEFLFQEIFSPERESRAVCPAGDRFSKTRGYIERKLDRKLSLKELAAAAGMSPEHFCREFRRTYGEAPLEMRNRLRISAAAKLIRFSTRPIKQIAEELGYSDLYHFSKAFKKQTGCPPGKFRNKTG
ncbi:MAG: AraC family transcriptional regulator [Victivallaceae bacterium]|nr:AraC family transcriptional regulator [Victivallaceae bacterium]